MNNFTCFFFCMASYICVGQVNYAYDNANRLILSKNSSNCSKTTYIYDADGNRQIQTTAITVTPQISSNGCYGANLGSISLSATNPSLAYTWSNGATGNSISNLSAGSYTVTIADAAHSNSCIKTYKVSQPAHPATHLLTTAITCHGYHNATASLDTAGANLGALIITWPDGTHGLSATNLGSGKQIVSLSIISAGCIIRDSFTISEPPSNIDTVLTNPVSCYGTSDGYGYVKVRGNTSLYSYQWPSGAATASLSNLSTGAYTVTVINNQTLCAETATVTILQPTKISMAPTILPSCLNQSSGSISASVSGGKPPYQFAINSGTYQSSSLFSNLGSANYTLSVRDGNYCEQVFGNLSVSAINCTIGILTTQNIQIFNVYPSPNNGEFFVSFTLTKSENYTITIYDISGKTAKTTSGYATGQNDMVDLHLSEVASGTYIVSLHTNTGNSQRQIEIVK